MVGVYFLIFAFIFAHLRFPYKCFLKHCGAAFEQPTATSTSKSSYQYTQVLRPLRMFQSNLLVCRQPSCWSVDFSFSAVWNALESGLHPCIKQQGLFVSRDRGDLSLERESYGRRGVSCPPA